MKYAKERQPILAAQIIYICYYFVSLPKLVWYRYILKIDQSTKAFSLKLELQAVCTLDYHKKNKIHKKLVNKT